MKVNLDKFWRGKGKPVQIGVGLSVSGVLLYFTFRGMDLGAIAESMAAGNPIYIAVAGAGAIVVQVLRTLRWGLMLRPLARVEPTRLFAVTSVGFMFVVLLPARLGELARPYLLSQHSQVNFSAALATVVLERIVDSIFMLALFAVSMSLMEFPPWITRSILIVVLGLLTVIGGLFVGGSGFGQRIVQTIAVRLLPARLASSLDDLASTFYTGMSAVRDVRHLTAIFFMSFVIWSVVVLINWVVFRATGVELGLVAALLVLVFTMLGIAMPAGPGFVGNYHFACLFALSFFNLSKEAAAAYAISLHAVSIGSVVLLGLLSLWPLRGRFRVCNAATVEHPDPACTH